jgi:holliday junction DNA helicase RuvA
MIVIMFSYLRGRVTRGNVGTITIDIHGMGYAVHCPVPLWESVQEDTEVTVYIYPYIREDRFDLFGFEQVIDKQLFEIFISQPGIGPKLGLELLSVPKNLFVQAIHDNDARILTSIKGIGKKTAEKLLVELNSIWEKSPNVLRSDNDTVHTKLDPDALAALEALGYDTKTAIYMLKDIPDDLRTEERVKAALKTL